MKKTLLGVGLVLVAIVAFVLFGGAPRTKGVETPVSLAAVEQRDDVLVRRVSGVNRSLTPEEAVRATGRKTHFRFPDDDYLDNDLFSTMPKGEGQEKDIVFFRYFRDALDDTSTENGAWLQEQYDRRGLVPVDPFTLMAFNKPTPADPQSTYFVPPPGVDAKERKAHSVVTFWVSNGTLRYLKIFERGEEKSVHLTMGVGMDSNTIPLEHPWFEVTWAAGVPK